MCMSDLLAYLSINHMQARVGIGSSGTEVESSERAESVLNHRVILPAPILTTFKCQIQWHCVIITSIH